MDITSLFSTLITTTTRLRMFAPTTTAHLAEGELTGTVIECPRHGAQFDITNGAVLRFPAITPVPWYPTRVENGEVQVLI